MEVSLGEIHPIVVNGNFTTDFLGIILLKCYTVYKYICTIKYIYIIIKKRNY